MNRAVVACASLLLLGWSQGGAQATECSDPAAIEDPRVLIEPCSAVIAAPSTTKEQRIQALGYRARAYRFIKDFPSALDDVNAGFALKADDASLHSTLAMIRQSQGDIPGAWAEAVKAMKLSPDDPLFLERLINLCLSYSLYGEAKELLDYAAATYPYHFGLKINRMIYYRAKLNYHETASILTDIFATSTATERDQQLLDWHGRTLRGDVALSIFLSEAALQGYQWDASLQAAERAVAIRRDAITLTARAKVHDGWPLDGQSPSRLPLALADADAAVAADPTFAHAHAVRGHILLYMHRYPEALTATNEALGLDPSDDSGLWQRFLIQRALDALSAAESDLVQYTSNPRHIWGVVQRLKRRGYWLGDEVPRTMTPVLKAGLRACVQDKACW